MKVGLLTFHSAHNYGAVLQAYATQEIVKMLGHDIEVIDYSPSYLIKQGIFPVYRVRSLSIKFKLFVEGIICLFWRYKRHKGFNDFIHSKLFVSSQKYLTPFTSNLNYDAFIMGSDQIWNIKLTKGFDDIYWGNFKIKEGAKRISYAASMSHYILTDQERQIMCSMLRNFNAISVREEELKEYLHENFSIESCRVMDPVFLLDRSQWKGISKKPSIHKKYVLVYSIDHRNDAVRIAKSIAKGLNAIVIELNIGVDKNVIFNKYQAASPEEFVGLFENAEFVITSSFHGTGFALICNKPFYSIAHGTDKDTRQRTILKEMGLLDRFISKDSEIEFESIDYRSINNRLELYRDASIRYLRENLDYN